jgi:hypothetical protein
MTLEDGPASRRSPVAGDAHQTGLPDACLAGEEEDVPGASFGFRHQAAEVGDLLVATDDNRTN